MICWPSTLCQLLFDSGGLIHPYAVYRVERRTRDLVPYSEWRKIYRGPDAAWAHVQDCLNIPRQVSYEFGFELWENPSRVAVFRIIA